ncbi:uncharacterized protein LOC143627860 isoform X2 [Bidens hawaiensis]|uniref:uncharacterized protein LOC143627860 isoform X2 n=1 Tax=Bidens hawaiensis TaxID=980011 RepID=UPI004049E14B
MKNMDIERDFVKEFESFKKICMELEEKSKRHETRCSMLETEVDNLRKKNQELEGKIETIQKVLDDDNIHEVMIENKVLECEKRKAETDVLFWKEKVKELESKVDNTNEKDGCPNKKMAPPTPGVAQSTFRTIIGISYEDVNDNEIPTVKSQSSSKNNFQMTDVEHTDEEHMDKFKVHSSNTRSAKRKRAANIIASDGDDDDDSYDDNAPICKLKTQRTLQGITDSDEEVEVEENVNRSRLTRLRNLESENKKHKNSNVVDDESEREDESLGGFIVDSSQSVSVYDSETGDSAAAPEDALNEYKETLDKIGRKKSRNRKWEQEADMLSDFGKDHILCMSAVCALYRQQTDDEKDSKLTIHYNERGFSQPDANSGSELAVFIMGRDPDGDLNKTVEELKEYDPKGVERCRNLALKYSKQLFKIYENKEDPYFPPAPYG